MSRNRVRRSSWRSLCRAVFFFFQAEDGIRDLTVTGVQTCALPISCMLRRPTPMPACCTAATSKPAPSSVMRSISQCGSGHCSCTCTHWARLCLITLRSEEHTSELQSQSNLVCRLLLEKKKKVERHTDK